MGDLGSTPGSGRFPGEGNGTPLQYSCLENPMDGGAWCRLLSWGCRESDPTERLQLQVVLVVKNTPANAGDLRDLGSIPGLGRFPGEGNSNPLQYSGLENPMDGEAWQTTVHGVVKSQT